MVMMNGIVVIVKWWTVWWWGRLQRYWQALRLIAWMQCASRCIVGWGVEPITHAHNYTCALIHTNNIITSHLLITLGSPYILYGNTLWHAREKVSCTSIPHALIIISIDQNFHRSSHRSTLSIGKFDSNISFDQWIFLDTNIPILSVHELRLGSKISLCGCVLFLKLLWVDLIHCIHIDEFSKFSSLPFKF